MVIEIFDKKEHISKTSQGTNFKSNNKIPREVRRLFKKKAKYSKMLYSVKTCNIFKIITQKLLDVEK